MDSTRSNAMTPVIAARLEGLHVAVIGAGSIGAELLRSLAAMGVRRVSVGGGLARVGWVAFAHAAKVLAEEGSFAGFAATVPSPFNPQAFFREDARSQQ